MLFSSLLGYKLYAELDRLVFRVVVFFELGKYPLGSPDCQVLFVGRSIFVSFAICSFEGFTWTEGPSFPWCKIDFRNSSLELSVPVWKGHRLL